LAEERDNFEAEVALRPRVNFEEVMEEEKDLPEELGFELSLDVKVDAIDEKLLLLLRPKEANRLAAAKDVIEFKPV